jgi:hypothetical protein
MQRKKKQVPSGKLAHLLIQQAVKQGKMGDIK